MNSDFKPFHIHFLSAELLRRKRENSSYSLRGFAKYLELGSSTLSRILVGSQEISLSTATVILKKLNMSEEDRVLFLASIAEDKRRRAFELLTSALDKEHASLESINSINPEWLLSKSPELIYVFNLKKQFLYANEAGAALHSRSPQELIGKTIRDICTSEEAILKDEAQLDQVIEEKKTLQLECFYTEKNCRWFEKIYLPILNKNNEVQAIACHFRDITTRKKIENDLRLLANAGKIFSSSYDYRKTLSDVVDLIVADFADGCFVHILYEENEVELFKVAHKQDQQKEILINLFSQYPYDPNHPNFYHRVLAKGEKQFFPIINESTLQSTKRNQDHLKSLIALNIGSYMCVPFKVVDKVIGSITIIRNQNTEIFNKNDLSLIEELSFRAAWAIDCAIKITKKS